MIPKNLEISGIHYLSLQIWEQVFRFLTGYFKVECVRAEVNPVTPQQFTGRTYRDIPEGLVVIPQGKNPFANKMR